MCPVGWSHVNIPVVLLDEGVTDATVGGNRGGVHGTSLWGILPLLMNLQSSPNLKEVDLKNQPNKAARKPPAFPYYSRV